MRLAVTFAVLLAVVATALVAVCQHSETRRLENRVWQLERRREQLERARQRLTSAAEATRTPRRLLEDLDTRGVAPAPEQAPRATPEPAGGPLLQPVPGFYAGSNFEQGDGR